MKLSNVIIYNGLSVAIKMMSLMGINKLLAYYAGPSSFAYISQLQNVINAALVLPVNSVSSATIKYTAELDESDRFLFIRTCTSIIIFFCVITAIVFFCLSDYFSHLFLGTYQYAYVFKIYSGTIFLFAANSFLISYLNGVRDLKGYVISNILGNLATFILSLILMVKFQLTGALLCIVFSQVLNALISFILVRKKHNKKMSYFIGLGGGGYLKKILKFSTMAIFAGFILPITLTLIRNIIISYDGVESAGIWDATWKLSSIYLMLISTTLSVYYLPVFSRLRSSVEQIREIIKGCVIVLLLTIVSAFFIYLMRDFIIRFLFSSSFIEMKGIIVYQLFGDVVKMLCWVIGYFIISKACVKEYIVTESIQWLSFAVFVYYFADWYGLIGVQYAYILSQVLYLSVLILSLVNYFKKRCYEI
nr:O-antigen translocase [Plesiomonas shigelloides]